MKKILCIGHISYDITVPFQGYPVENTKNRVTDMVECGGGPASNAAYLLGKWGMNTTMLGVVGADIYGERILDEFKHVNVNTKSVEVDFDNETSLSFIIANKETGSRTTFTHHSNSIKLKKKYKLKADIILVDGQELEASVEAINYNPRAISILDAGTLKEENITLGKLVKYVVCSKNFAESYTGIKIDLTNGQSIIDIFNNMETAFKNVIITLEDKGCLYKENSTIKLMPTLKVKAVDSTGAGDIFHGAFTYAIANDFPLEKAIKIANITGALSVTKIGGRNSVFPLDEVMKIYEQNN